ncbi:MAG: hypothetical protein K2X64_07385 [Rhodocyclaceae bacterium]|nr:hypothetical protein [Rhodocyclaceae bacterium]
MPASPASLTTVEGELISLLSCYLSPQSSHIENAASKTSPKTEAGDIDGENAATDCWHLSLRFGPDLFRNGMDPLSIIRYLGTLGDLVRVVTVIEGIPALAELDPETNYLGFEIALRSTADKSVLEGAFEFVQDGSRIRMLPPHSKISEYITLIETAEGESLRLGEILVACGSLTDKELAQALRMQAIRTGVELPIGQLLVEECMVQPAVVEAALVKQKQSGERIAAQKTIRVDADKLDALINLYLPFRVPVLRSAKKLQQRRH